MRWLPLLMAIGCGAPEPAGPAGPPLPWPREAFPQMAEPEHNRSTPAKVELGRMLFYDPILSSDRAVACATCHSEIWGMTDGLARSVGVGGVGPTGPGRTGDNVTARNAQTLWNAGWRASLFWDGRSASLEEQVLEPMKAPEELGRDPAEAARDLAAIPEYAALFAAAFPDSQEPVSVAHLTHAIAAFERTLVSRRAPYDAYVRGDTGALSAESVRGMFLFAGAGCADCHRPPLFDSERFEDRGRGETVRVPTLRNVRESGPYFHDGSEPELTRAVRHEAPAMLDEEEIAAIATFLSKGLTDLTAEPARPRRVPSGLPVPVDGFRVAR
jgi:cytochrome c peroxidase